MAKRFFETSKFDDNWYRRLTPKLKCLWEFMLCKCDVAGVWELDLDVASFYVGEKITIDEFKQMFDIKIQFIREDKVWIKNFIEFQYGQLSKDCKPHIKVFALIDKQGLPYLNEPVRVALPLAKGSQRVEDKDKEEDKEKEKEEDKEKIGVQGKEKQNFELVWEKYPKKVGRKQAERHFNSSVKSADDMSKILNAVDNYKQSKRFKSGFIQDGATWFNNWQDWIVLPDSEREFFKTTSTAIRGGAPAMISDVLKNMKEWDKKQKEEQK